MALSASGRRFDGYRGKVKETPLKSLLGHSEPF